MPEITPEEAVVVKREIQRLKGQAWGVAFGLLLGLGLFAATVILVLKGGENIGQHLGLLSAYLPGYSVSFAGAAIGFIYMFVIGYALGRLVGSVYNRMAGLTG